VVCTVDAAYDRSLPDGLQFEVEQVEDLFERGEATEGLRAFIAKRAPQFA
jgi:enoyl-CoA hydratase/carnithine racemase